MSLSLDIKRIGREGVIAFWRNKIVSFAAIVVMTMSLLVLSGVLFLNAVLGFSLGQLEDRVDVNIYFFPDTPVEEITILASTIEEIPEVRDVSYVSREEAFESFRLRHEGDDLIERSLEELGDNPLGASLNIRAFDSADYEDIVTSIEALPAVSNADFVERINFYDNQTLIERLNQFISVAQSIGYAGTIFFAAVAVLVIISTLRIAIYAAKNDLIVKRLVGAEHRYVRGPFLVQGILYGIISTFLTTAILFPITQRIGAYTETFFGGMDIAQYYQTNGLAIFIILLSFAVILGIVATAISVKKYLKV
jgi:cell division transport system permease protein